MIRKAELKDAPAIRDIYNEYVVKSDATFETDPVTVEQMEERISHISHDYPYFVYEEAGQVIGYSYAHPWKERAAYRFTLETTVYISPSHKGKGVGLKLMERLISECKERGFHALIACITEGNEASNNLHLKLGFRQVSKFDQVGMKFDRWLGVVDFELILDK